jgi:signal transduction histidine kinase/BarA-like signal transduction histidine kinase
VIYLLTGGLGLVLFELITSDVRETLGRDFVGKQALYDKSRLELPIQREVALALKLANSPTLHSFSRHEGDEAYRARGLDELESFRESFHDKSYFFVPHGSLHFYFCDARSDPPGGGIAYTLERGKAKDKWYFTTIAHPEAFSLNVDYDEKLKVTKIWINTNVRDGAETLGVVGTGFDLSSFLETFIGSGETEVTNLLLDESGAIQAHADPSYIDENSQTKAIEDRKTIFPLLDNPADRAAFRARLKNLVAGDSTVETLFVDLEGERVLAGVCYLPELRWFNVTAIDVDSLASTKAFFPVVLLLSFSLLSIVIAILVLMRTVVLRPLSELARSTASIMAGREDPPSGVVRDDEIGQLMETFSRMRNTVRETLSSMEDKVRERTTELETARRSAEEANRAKGAFLANTSHELRTPLNAMLGMIRLTLDTELTQQQRSDLTNATAAAKSLLGILNDILDFSKIEAGKLTVEHRAFKLKPLAEAVIGLTEQSAKAKGLELNYRSDPALPETLIGDALRVQQVLLNLVSNAVKFTERGEVVLGISMHPGTEGRVRFSVRDTGIGISNEKQNTLFRPFTQVDDSTTRRFGGTGLGLSISRSLVQLMGGSPLLLESEEGLGSELSFSLPIGTPDPEALQAVDPEQESLPSLDAIRGARLLLVEDNRMNREIVVRLLESRGIEVVVAHDGVEALERINETFDGVLMDLQMPRMSGYEAAREMRKRFNADKLPIIAMSANAMEADRQRSREAGMNAHIGKPIEFALFFEILLKWVWAVRRGAQEETS